MGKSLSNTKHFEKVNVQGRKGKNAQPVSGKDLEKYKGGENNSEHELQLNTEPLISCKVDF